MRERAASLRAAGVDEYADEATQALLDRRVAALADDGTTPLFFGRTDHGQDSAFPGQAFHIGRCHVQDEQARPVVVDWRADVGRPFYRASAAERLGLSRRRRFGFAQGRLTSYEDEVFATGEGAGAADRALRAEIERPRVGPMRDIVATIQPEQDDLIRAPLAETVCIQGSPGTGKTAIGLHRAAYLLYEHRRRLARDGVLVVGPNRAFMAYVSRVLPGLGEVRVTQLPVDEVVSGPRVSAVEDPDVARLKGDTRMAEVLRRAVFGQVTLPSEPLAIRCDSRWLRLPAAQLRAIVVGLVGRGVRYGAGRALLRDAVVLAFQRLAEGAGGVAGFDVGGDVSKALQRSREAGRYLDQVWPALNPLNVVFRLLSDRESFAVTADGLLEADEQAALCWSPRPRGRKSAAWTVADLFLIDEATAVIDGVPTYGHVVIDEAQDLSPMQLRALGRRCRAGSATLLGDLAQATAPWAVERWETAVAHLGKAEAHVASLPRAFRAPRTVLDFANQLLPSIAPDVVPAASVRDVPEALEVRAADPAGVWPACLEAVRAALRREGSVAVIVADAAVRQACHVLAAAGVDHHRLDGFDPSFRLTVAPASQVKGLEFDRVVVLEPADIVAAEPRGRRRLYIVLTRAVLKLTVVHTQPLPAPLQQVLAAATP